MSFFKSGLVKKSRFFVSLLIIFSLIFLISVGSIFLYLQYEKLISDKDNLNKKQAEYYLNQLSKVFILPEDEEPSIATIVDKSKLADHPFFEKSINGDKVFIFSKDKQVVLFRPSLGKIVAIGSMAAESSVESEGLEVGEEDFEIDEIATSSSDIVSE